MRRTLGRIARDLQVTFHQRLGLRQFRQAIPVRTVSAQVGKRGETIEVGSLGVLRFETVQGCDKFVVGQIPPVARRCVSDTYPA